MSDHSSSRDEIPVATEVVERQEGVTVKCQSTRGTGTRDQDKVTVTAHYDDVTEVDEWRDMLISTTRLHMRDLRKMGENGVPHDTFGARQRAEGDI